MSNIAYGIREYKCSEKTKRPQKKAVDFNKLEKRNSNQKRLYITLENIDEIFSNNDDKFPVCYDMLFNLIQGKVTKFFKTRNYDRKKDLSYDCVGRLYSILKRKLLKLKDNGEKHPTLFFYLSQFFRYIDLLVYSEVFYGTRDQKYMIQEQEEFENENIISDDYDYYNNSDEEYEFSNSSIMNINIFNDNANKIKLSIENNKELDNAEKRTLLKVYDNSYSSFGSKHLTKRDNQILSNIQEKIKKDKNLLKDLMEICNG